MEHELFKIYFKLLKAYLELFFGRKARSFISYHNRFKNYELLKIIEAKNQLKHLLHFNTILTKTDNYLKHKKHEKYLCITITYY